MDVATAKAYLSEAANTRSYADDVSSQARKAVEDAKKSTQRLQSSIDGLNDTIAAASSFDAQWEAFKRKFDDLNKKALGQLAGMMGASTGASRRPAEMISEARAAQVLARASRLVVLTGAGISAESGIPTFRGADGFWTVGSENYRPQELATWEKFNEMPDDLWRWYQYRWGICTKAQPNQGHHALVQLQNLVRGNFTLVTQNIDGLHLQAGSDRNRLYEIHGCIDEMRCDERIEGACLHGLDLSEPDTFVKARSTIFKTPTPAKEEKDEKTPHCSMCGVRQRPKILWFDESYNEAFYGYRSVCDAMQQCDVLLIVGTQLTTGLPNNMLRTALSKGTTIIKMDTIVDLADEKSAGMLHLQAKSGEALPRIVAHVQKLLQEPELAPLKSLSSQGGSEIGASSLRVPDAKVQNKGGSTPSRASSPASMLARNKPASATPSRASSLARRRPSYAMSNASAPMTPLARTPAPGSRSNSKTAHHSSPSGGPAQRDFRSRSSGSLKAAASASLQRNSTSRPGSANSEPSVAAEGFFVYGTLRPDDDSGASWTKPFIEGFQAEAAVLPGASLYIDGRYPAVCLEETMCSVRGVFLCPSSAADLQSKLAEADRIEGYPDLYDRTVVRVHTTDGVEKQAYLYHRTGKFDRTQSQRILDGDWLSRKRE